MMSYGMWFGAILMNLFGLVVLVFVVYLLVRALDRNSTKQRTENKLTEKSLQILDERYSKGEIDDEEYLRKKKNLLE
ncbi:SHOCT domain-containing protein [Dethiobacter alkaliphilus]|uniref:SHOCT domain-containing protein n=1 Tax=Dethiobacter alkaliphilus AHT 1 TaxID=555088 RepID=C0GG76_DETAL|nr:SHOCT domain-containing protein [Dethiobacter alkaliphilus]EEG77765.1 conserved hypothetical protein [Dethiobacter alkaliphilus AHT 1]MCW3491121.1 SHOCT domain-containing protein [Dethiobacter alkaliphilus]